jgi:DUF4097 and DUF4098 domain-containing protein YvlB
MKRLFIPLIGALILILLVAAVASARGGYQKSKTFDPKSQIDINTVSADCVVKGGSADKIMVDVDASYSPAENFDFEIDEDGDRLEINEVMYGSNRGGGVAVLTVPDETRVSFNTASGNFEAADLKGNVSVNTASGNIELVNCRGKFNISTASGDIDAEEFVPVKRCRFSSASGDVQLKLASTPEDNLALSSASGDAILDFNGHPIKGYIEMTCRNDRNRGRIESPIKFDNVEEFERFGQGYITKSFTRDSESPRISVETASGKAALRE